MKKLTFLFVTLFVFAVFPREASAGPRFHISVGVPINYHYEDYGPVYSRSNYYCEPQRRDYYRPRHNSYYRKTYRASRYYDNRYHRPVRRVYRTTYHGY